MATRILGLDLGADSLKATIIEAKLRSFEVVQCVTQPIPPPEEAPAPPVPAATPGADFPPDAAGPVAVPDAPATPFQRAVERLFARPGMAFDEIVCSIPGHLVSTRIIQLPFTSRSKIAMVLPSEIEDQVPFEMDGMTLAHQVLATGKKTGAQVLAALVKNADLSRILGDLKAAAAEPKILTLSSGALAVAAHQALHAHIEPYAVVDLGKTKTEIVVFSGGHPCLLRTLPMGGTQVTAELSRLLESDLDKTEQLKTQVGRIYGPGEALPSDVRISRLSEALRTAHETLLGRVLQTIRGVEKEGGFRVATVYMTGGGSLLPGLDTLVAEKLGVDVQPLPIFGTGIPSLVEDTAEKSGLFAQSLGLALAGTSFARLRAVNFRIGEFAYHKITQEVQGSLRGLAAMAGVLLALFLVLVVQSRSVEAKRVSAIDGQIRKIYTETFNQEPPGGDALAAFKSQIAQVTSKYEILGYLGDGDLRALEVLKAMSESIPKETAIDVKQFDLKKDFVKIEAMTDTYQTVDKIVLDLKKNPAFRSVKSEDTKKMPDDKLKFKLTIRLAEEKAGSKTGVTTLTQKGKADTVPMGAAPSPGGAP